MATLPPEVRASYVVIIDGILAKSDLNTVTSKRVRQGLQNAVDYDITPQKDAIKALIAERFEKVLAEKSNETTVNGHDTEHDGDTKEASYSPPSKKTKRKSDSEDDYDLSDVRTSPPPKKKQRKPAVEDDATLAARLQAEENSRARPTRGGSTRKAAPMKRKSPKKKSASKIKDDDSELDGSGAERKVNRNGGFHKPLGLSPPLSALLDGETQMSRPQAVKRIWQYVKERDLQDPKDKRLIRCDDALRAVFKSDRVHMFTMNKILSDNLFEIE